MNVTFLHRQHVFCPCVCTHTCVLKIWILLEELILYSTYIFKISFSPNTPAKTTIKPELSCPFTMTDNN